MSAPELARELETDWRLLPAHQWPTVTFRVLDRMIRKNLAQCFARSGHHLEAQQLVEWPLVGDADSWRRSLLLLRDLSQTIPGSDTQLLAAYCCVMGNVPAALLDEPDDVVLQRASAIALVLENMSVGAFDAEVAAQREDIHAMRPPE